MYTCMCMCELAHGCTCVYIAWIALYACGFVICTCVYVCVSVHCSPPCILGHRPLAKRKAENKLTGLRGKDEGCPRGLKFRHPIPYLEVVSPIDSKGNVISSHLTPHPCVSESHLLPYERRTEKQAKPLEGRAWGRTCVGQRANLQECPNGKATLHRTFS